MRNFGFTGTVSQGVLIKRVKRCEVGRCLLIICYSNEQSDVNIIALDIYLPVLPYLDKALNTSREMVQYTVAFFLLGS